MENKKSRQLHMMAAFLAMEPINVLMSIARELGRGSITEEVQIFIHEQCINNRICRNYPPNQLYVKNFLKKIIAEAESQFIEVLDILYEQYAQYLTYCKDFDLSQNTGKCYRSLMFMFPSSNHSPLAWHENQQIREPGIMTVTLRSSLNMLEGGTGCCIWPSSLFLSEFVLSHPQLFSSKCCFEVGSGVGLVGICLANVKASKVILSDGDLSSLSNMKFNLETNQVAIMEKLKQKGCQDPTFVESRYLTWESASADELQNCGAEVILGADVIYDPSCVPHLVRVLAALLGTKNGSLGSHDETSVSEEFITYNENRSIFCSIELEKPDKNQKDNKGPNNNAYPVAYIANVIRNFDTFNCFLRVASEAGLSVIDITEKQRSMNLLPYISSFDRTSIHLYRISSLDSMRDTR